MRSSTPSAQQSGNYAQYNNAQFKPQSSKIAVSTKIVIIFMVSVFVLVGLSFMAGALIFRGNATSIPTPIATSIKIENRGGADWLVWDAVKGASSYNVHTGSTQIRETASNSIKLDFVRYDENYSFRVSAVGANNASSNWTSPFHYKKPSSPTAQKLATPTIRQDGTLIVWDEIPNASSYEVFDSAQPLAQQTTQTFFDPSSLQGYGQWSIMVRANGDGLNYSNSELSNTIIYENLAPNAIPLSPPTNLKVENSIFGWSSVSNAIGYNIKINNSNFESSTNSFVLPSLAEGTHTLQVQAKGDGQNYSNSTFAQIQHTISKPVTPPDNNKLATPQVKLSGKSVIWEAIPNASNYEVNIDGSTSQTSNTSADLSYLTAYKTYEIKVRALAAGQYTTSDWSRVVLYIVSDINNPLSPDAAAARFSKYISRNEYENELFPNRFGTRNWKDDKAEIGSFYPNAEFRESRTDYYSYDNWLVAIKTLASLSATYEWVDGVQYLTQVTNRATGITRNIVNPTKRGTGIRETVEYGDFLNSANENDNRREISGFFAHMAKESGAYGYLKGDEGWAIEAGIDKYEWGFAFNEETSYIGSTNAPYSEWTHETYPPVEGKSYHGRGPIQLSWNYNYGFFSELIFGDKNVLLQAPERVSEEGQLGIMSALWFWMTPQAPKASCHDIMLDYFVHAPSSPYFNCFGLTIVVVNGYYEADKLPEEWPQVGHRITYYKRFVARTQADITGEKLDTKGFPQWGSL